MKRPTVWSVLLLLLTAGIWLRAGGDIARSLLTGASTRTEEIEPATFCVVGDRAGRVTAWFDFGCHESMDERPGACAIDASGDTVAVLLMRPSALTTTSIITTGCSEIRPVHCASVPVQSWRRRLVLDGVEQGVVDIPVAPAAPACFVNGKASAVAKAPRGLLALVDPLRGASEALTAGRFDDCLNVVGRVPGHEGAPGLVLDAAWLGAQCALLARQHDMARASLQRFIDEGDRRDLRHPVVEAQLAVLARGDVPEGVRTPPASQAEADALVTRLREERKATPLPTGFVVEQSTPRVLGSLDAQVVTRIVTEKLDELRRCVAPGTMAPDGGLRIVLKWVVNGAGKVMQAQLAEGAGAPTDERDRCLTTRVRSWTFPPLPQEGIAIVTQPLVFRSASPSRGTP